MIEFNKKDYNLPEVEKLSDFFDVKTNYNYRIYGLKQEDNLPVLIEFDSNNIQLEKFNPIVEFFTANKINIKVGKLNENKGKIYIGLRKDIRDNTQLSRAIIQTIIYNLENKLNLSKNDKINNIPEFK